MKVEMENPTEPNWLELPRDITKNILQRLGTIEIITSACQVCPLWWNICKDPHMWRTIRMSRFRLSCYYSDAILVKICHNAVERSCGQLEEIDIEGFATDDLLEFIANCASHLWRIRLYWCERISDEGFCEAVKKLPLLMELDLSETTQLSKVAFEVVGCFCPILKSLKYGGTLSFMNGRIFPFEVLVAIAETMPGLCHLKISGNVHTNEEGLLAILNGCPFLESLHLRKCHCFYFQSNESLMKRCYEQIKDFRLPLQLQAYDDDDDNDSDYYTDYINWCIRSGNSYGFKYDDDFDWDFQSDDSEDDYYGDIFLIPEVEA